MTAVLGECCTTLSIVFLEIAVPFTVALWGGVWVWKTRWSRVPPDRGERRLFRIMLAWVVVTLAELTVLVCIAASRP
jgi:hypothetical protein